MSATALGRDAELLGRAPQQQRVPDRIRGRQQQQQARVIAEAFQPPREALLDPARQSPRRDEPESSSQLRGGQPSR
jgi:hypothetical protein